MARYAIRGRNPLDGDEAHGNLPRMFNELGWNLKGDGLWWQEGATQGQTTAQVRGYEDIVEVHAYKIGTAGRVRASYEIEVWVENIEAAQTAADALIESVSVGDMELDMPDSSDFEGWASGPKA